MRNVFYHNGLSLSVYIENSQNGSYYISSSLAVLRQVYDGLFLPGEEEVSETSSENHGKAEPNVVSHKYQHEEI